MLLLHVTTHLTGKPHDGLLKTYGFAGFPSLAFLDAKGGLIARHEGARNLAELGKTAGRADAYLALRTKAEAGDAVAQQHLFVQDLGLHRFTFSQGELRYAGLKDKLPAELRKRAEQHLVDLQYAELTGALRAQLPKLDRSEYSRRYAELSLLFFAAGKIPGSYHGTGLLSAVLRHAQQTRDAALFGQALEAFKQRTAGDARYARSIDRYTKQLEELRGN